MKGEYRKQADGANDSDDSQQATQLFWIGPLASSLLFDPKNDRAVRCPCCGSTEGIKISDSVHYLPSEVAAGDSFDCAEGGSAVLFSCSCGSTFSLEISLHAGQAFAGWFAPLSEMKAVQRRKRAVKSAATEKQLRYLAMLAQRAGYHYRLPDDLTKAEAGRAISMLKAGETPPFMQRQGDAEPIVAPEEVAKRKAADVEQDEARIAELRELGTPVNDATGLFIKSELPEAIQEDWQTESQWGLRRMRPKEGAKPVLMHVMSTWRKSFRAYYHVDDLEPIPYRRQAGDLERRRTTPQEAVQIQQEPSSDHPEVNPDKQPAENKGSGKKNKKGKRKKGKKKSRREA